MGPQRGSTPRASLARACRRLPKPETVLVDGLEYREELQSRGAHRGGVGKQKSSPTNVEFTVNRRSAPSRSIADAGSRNASDVEGADSSRPRRVAGRPHRTSTPRSLPVRRTLDPSRPKMGWTRRSARRRERGARTETSGFPGDPTLAHTAEEPGHARRRRRMLQSARALKGLARRRLRRNPDDSRRRPSLASTLGDA